MSFTNSGGLFPILMLALFGAFAEVGQSQTAQAGLTVEERRDAIHQLVSRILESYVFEDAAKRIAAHLEHQLTAGAFEALTTPEALAAELTKTLRAVSGDSHFEVEVRRTEQVAADSREPSAEPSWLGPLRHRNYDFVKVEILPGNVGYLKIDSCPPPEVAGETAAAAMAFLANAEAIILDLRDNGGGDGAMVQFLASYFFTERTALTRTFRRAENQTVTDYTLGYVPGRRMPLTELLFVTSPRTHSAAEALAFSLQQLKRATVVGERTRGGANAGRFRTLNEQFRVFVPVAHATSAATGKSWDREGIQPDVPVVEAESVHAAHREALQRLLTKYPGGDRRQEILRLLSQSSQ